MHLFLLSVVVLRANRLRRTRAERCVTREEKRLRAFTRVRFQVLVSKVKRVKIERDRRVRVFPNKKNNKRCIERGFESSKAGLSRGMMRFVESLFC